jgi:hypothetical protein
MPKPTVINFTDFRGGYATQTAPEMMDDNMLVKAENVYWHETMMGRPDKTIWSTALSTAVALQGIVRHNFNGLTSWSNFVAIEKSSYVAIAYGDQAAYTTLSGISFTTGYQVEMDVLGNAIIAVNGVERPHIITYTTAAGYAASTLDRYDMRTISTMDWIGGYRYTTGTTEYVDQTSALQGSSAAYISPTTLTSDGHYVASNYPFTRAVYTSASNVSSTAVAAYHYWTSTGWKVFTSSLELDPQWTTSTGRSTAIADRTMEWPWFTDWIPYNSTAVPSISNKYPIRVTFPTAGSTVATFKSVAEQDIHYLTRIINDGRPHLVHTHNNRVWLGDGINVYYSPYNKVTGWEAAGESGFEYFQDGGDKITALETHLDYLLIVKPAALYGYYGNSYQNWTKRKLSNLGGQYKRSVVSLGQVIMFLAREGVRLWDGTNNFYVSHHIENDLETYTWTDANALNYRGHLWLAFPNGEMLLWADPDSLRQGAGNDQQEVALRIKELDQEQRVSWYKWTGYRVDKMLWAYGAGDNGYILGIDAARNLIYRLDRENGYDETSTGTVAVTLDMKSKYLSFGAFQTYKKITRFKPDLKGVGNWSFIMSADNAWSTLTTDVTVALVSTAADHWSTDISVPYQMDGKTIAFELITATTNPKAIYGLSADVELRRY